MIYLDVQIRPVFADLVTNLAKTTKFVKSLALVISIGTLL